VARCSRDLLVLLRGAVEIVKARDRLVQRLRAEQDCERIVRLLLVQRVQPECELPLGDAQVVACNAETALNGLPCTLDLRCLAPHGGEAGRGASKLGIERVETEERGV